MEFVALLLIPTFAQEEFIDDDQNDLLSYMIRVIRKDALDIQYDDNSPIELSVTILKRIFRAFGEDELANRNDLLEHMVAAAASDGTKVPLLDANTLGRVMTGDLGAYTNSDSSYNNRKVIPSDFRRHRKKRGMLTRTTTSASVDSQDRQTENHLELESTVAHIDLAADTVRSRTLVVFTWASFVISFFTYYSSIGNTNIGNFLVSPIECEKIEFSNTAGENVVPFLCTIGWSMAQWLYIVIVMSIYGLAYFGLTNIGNGIETRNPFLSLSGAIAATLFTIVPLMTPSLQHGDDIVSSILVALSLVLGGTVAVLNALDAVSLTCFRGSKWVIPDGIRTEELLQKASEQKVNRMVENARSLHREEILDTAIISHTGQALLNYAKYGNITSETVGGTRWAWSHILNLEIFGREGMWFSNRLISINVAQFLLSGFVAAVGLAGTILVTENYEPPDTAFNAILDQLFNVQVDVDRLAEVTQTVSSVVSNFIVDETPVQSFDCPSLSEPVDCSGFDSLGDCVDARGTSWLCTVVDYTMENGPNASSTSQEGLLRGAGLNLPMINRTSADALLQSGQDAIQTLYPTEKYMIFWPLLIGTIVAFVTALSIAFVTIPSITTTTLKLRSGVIDLLRSPRKHGLRKAPDQVTFLQGAMFWGILFSAGLMGFVFAFLLFLLLWQSTASIAQQIIATILGLVVVVLLQVGSAKLCRTFLAEAYYRKRPKSANIIFLTRECAFFGLTIFTALVRVVKLIVTSIFFVGRMDVPFLAPGVAELEYFGVYLDNHPQIFLMDILQHEAHRHPLVETFGVMNLLKLQHGREFGTKAGSTWRLLFVLILMPWLTKYRSMARPDMRDLAYEKEYDETDDQEEKSEDLKRHIRRLNQQLLIMQASAESKAAQRGMLDQDDDDSEHPAARSRGSIYSV